MYGVQSGVLYGQNERVEELNDRVRNRHFPDKPLAPNFSGRPILSKYSRFQIYDGRRPAEEQIVHVPPHNVNINFSPATSRGPPSTIIQNIDLESALRNQNVALQRNPLQGVYVPDSSSDLYKIQIPSSSSSVLGSNPHPSLFHRNDLSSTPRELNVHHMNIGQQTFNNHTKTQLRTRRG